MWSTFRREYQLIVGASLQSILNAAARLILRIPKFGSISSAIRDLGSYSSSVSSFIAVWPVQLHPISPSFVLRFLPLLDVKACARPPMYPFGAKGQDRMVRSTAFLLVKIACLELITAKNSLPCREA